VRESLLDTDILSEIARKRHPAVLARARAYTSVHGKLTTSAVTVMEVVQGHQRLDRQPELNAFLASLSLLVVLPFGPDEAEIAGRIHGDLARQGRPIGRADPMIAAIAIVHERVLVTGNTAHYLAVVDAGYALELENWRDFVADGGP
jgi:tRNA(fMet)-specific endonuclease VapC